MSLHLPSRILSIWLLKSNERDKSNSFYLTVFVLIVLSVWQQAFYGASFHSQALTVDLAVKSLGLAFEAARTALRSWASPSSLLVVASTYLRACEFLFLNVLIVQLLLHLWISQPSGRFFRAQIAWMVPKEYKLHLQWLVWPEVKILTPAIPIGTASFFYFSCYATSSTTSTTYILLPLLLRTTITTTTTTTITTTTTTAAATAAAAAAGTVLLQY